MRYDRILEDLLNRDDFLVVGRSVVRTDALDKVLGRAKFTADYIPRDTAVVKVVRSPHPHALIEGIDVSPALKLPGVRMVITAADIPGVNQIGYALPDQPFLNDVKTRFVGDPVALVVAADEGSAIEGADAVRVKYSPLPAVLDTTDALMDGAPLVQEGGNVALTTKIRKGDIEKGFSEAKMLVDSDGNTYGTVGGGGMERRLEGEALKALAEGRPQTITFALGVKPREGTIPINSRCGGEVKIFMDIVKPDPRLIVIGSGHIGMPLAHEAGFETIVVDDAPTTTRERFPHATEIHSGPFDKEIDELKTTPADYVAIVHSESWYELTSLRGLLSRKPAYVGLLGSESKAEKISEKLISDGLSAEDVARIVSPLGIEIGAETPEEIAVSIVAELIKVRRLGAP